MFHAEAGALSQTGRLELAALLLPEEQKRATEFVFDDARDLHIVAHALLARVLRPLVEGWPIAFSRNAFGKPELSPPQGNPNLRFNLTHTRGFVACAVTRGRDIGIDAERIDRSIEIDGIGRLVFAPAELEWLGARKGGAQIEGFFALWTLKEAFIKALGQGLSLPLQEIVFDVDRLQLVVAAGEDPAHWQFARWSPTASHRLALAVRRTPGRDLPIAVEKIDPMTLSPR